jgi:NADPH:quinone reductase-like Zn-dependent oxidoreductase
VRAIVQERYGLDALELREREPPRFGEGDVLLRVHAAGVDQGVWHLVAGRPSIIRLAGFGLRRPRRPVPGTDVAGRVEAVGDGVAELRPGDDVFGTCVGSYAELAAARADRLVRKPASLDFEQAAAVPFAGCAALQAVRDRARVRPGQHVLVIGAGGGVGTFAVQIAKAYGAEVTGVCSPRKADLVRALGADHVVDYTREEIADRGLRYDAILDIAGNRPLRLLRRALAPRGTLVIVGGEDGGPLLGGLDRQLRAMALSPFVRQSLGTWVSSEPREDLERLCELLASGAITVPLERTFGLDEAAAALRYLREGRVLGKVVLTNRGV